MPAVTVANPMQLPVVDVPEPNQRRDRPVVSVTTAPSGLEGLGFPVRRAFAGVSRAVLDPFVHMDQLVEVEYPPGAAVGTGWHPHRGFETVTYMIDGRLQHRDSHGGGGEISDGDTQWMTAGSGILHIEEPPKDMVTTGGLFHGVQLWVNLPSSMKWVEPRYQSIDRDAVALRRSPDGRSLVRIIAGNLAGGNGPGVTYTPIVMAHATVQPGAELEIGFPEDANSLVYVLGGEGTVGTERRKVQTGQLVVFGAGNALTFAAAPADAEPWNSRDLDLLVLGGKPIGEPVVQRGPFVMNTEQEIRQAFTDFENGRMGTIPRSG